jgi:hypothetical protein
MDQLSDAQSDVFVSSVPLASHCNSRPRDVDCAVTLGLADTIQTSCAQPEFRDFLFSQRCCYRLKSPAASLVKVTDVSAYSPKHTTPRRTRFDSTNSISFYNSQQRSPILSLTLSTLKMFKKCVCIYIYIHTHTHKIKHRTRCVSGSIGLLHIRAV